MNILKSLGHVFAQIGKVVGKGVQLAVESGLTDELIAVALPYVKKANTKFVDNDKRREWVVAQLVAKKIPEGVARMAVELAYKLYRKELEKVGV